MFFNDSYDSMIPTISIIPTIPTIPTCCFVCMLMYIYMWLTRV